MPDTHGMSLYAPITAAETEDEIWLEVTRAVRPSAPLAPNTLPAVPASAVPPATALPLPDLLALDGPAFIGAAYATILGRVADPVGTAAIQNEMARGCTKLDVARLLRRSPEGREAGRPLPGLRRRLLARRIHRVPVLGRVTRVGAALIGPYLPDRRSATVAHAAQAGLEGRLAAYEAAIDDWRITMQERFNQQQLAVDAATRRLAIVQAANEELSRRVAASLLDQASRLAALAAQGEHLSGQVRALEDGTMQAVLALAATVTTHDGRLLALEDAVGQTEVAARIDSAAGGLRAELDGRVVAAEAAAAEARQLAAGQDHRIGLMLHALRSQVPATAAAADDHALDALYVQFEDRFRGSRAAIKQRQRVYLPRLLACGAGRPGAPILDIGAGRGEFLEVLREEGLSASGVDANAAMAEACAASGLACAEADALDYLASLPTASLGAVTGFHIIEHIPFKGMVRIMDEALRVLAPGGLLILETPNPANILTASRFFYLDPTHRNPLPGEMVAMIAEARGFSCPEILPLHPMDARFPGADRQLAAALDAIFHGPQDYALIARRP